jgi:hypothetical protein
MIFFYIAFLIAYMAVRDMIAMVPGRIVRKLFVDTFFDPMDRKKR